MEALLANQLPAQEEIQEVEREIERAVDELEVRPRKVDPWLQAILLGVFLYGSWSFFLSGTYQKLLKWLEFL